MDPVSLSVGALVARLVAKASERAVDATVESGEGVLRALVDRVRHRFSDADDEGGSRVLELVQDAPDSAKTVTALAAAIDRHAPPDSAFATELWQLVERARSEGVRIESISQGARGDQTTQIAGVAGSHISITHDQPPKPAV